jgi:hypothetical protein
MARRRVVAETTADGFPGYVRGWICKAREKTMQRGYRDVGHLLYAKLRIFRPAHVSLRVWSWLLGNLTDNFVANDRAAVQHWFRENYPALMRLIPERRHREFVAGLLERAKDEHT